MEFHWYEDYYDIPKKERGYLDSTIGYTDTLYAVWNKNEIIHSVQSHFFSNRTIDLGYRLFAHFISGDVVEVKRGADNTCTNREIRQTHNLEKMLLAGEFGQLALSEGGWRGLELIMSWLNAIAIIIISVSIFRQSKKIKSILNNRYSHKFDYYNDISKVRKKVDSLSEEIRKMRLDKTSEISGGLMSEELYRNSYIVTFPGNIHISDKYLNDVAELALRTIVSNLPEGKQGRRVVSDVVSRIKEIMDSKKIEL